MSGEDLLHIGLRWVHILSAIIAVGGAIFMRFVLMPSVRETLSDDQHAALREKVMGRWRKVVMSVVGLLLLTGLANFALVSMPKLKANEEIKGIYHMIFGIKFMLAMGVFFLASALAGRSRSFDALRANAPKWLSVLVLLGVVVVMLGSVLGRLQ